MKAYLQTACLLGFAAFSMVSGQAGLASLPDCAKPCAANLPAECGKLDFKCICGSSTWIADISCCVFKACSTADQQNTLDVANQLCSVVGVTLPSVASCPSSTIAATAASASTSSTTAAPASASSTTSQSTSSSGSAESASSKQSSSSSVAATRNSATTNTGSSASLTTSGGSSSSPAAVSTGVAGHLVGNGIGAAGAAALALAFI